MNEPARSHDEVEEAMLAARAAGAPIPDTEDELVFHYRHRGGLRPEINAALHRLPPERFARFGTLRSRRASPARSCASLLALPEAQVRAWLAKLAKTKSAKTKQLAADYAKQLAKR